MQNNELQEIKQILVGFIQEQTTFNEEIKGFMQEQKAFNEEQKAFNENIDKKVDKIQYFLEETIAENTKMFFEEQIEMKNYIRELEGKIVDLENKFTDLSSRVNLLFKTV